MNRRQADDTGALKREGRRVSQSTEPSKWNRDLSQLKGELLALSPGETLSVSGNEWADIISRECKRLGMPAQVTLSNASRIVINDWLARYPLKLWWGHDPDDIMFERIEDDKRDL